jgi:chromosome segregation protein
VSLLDRRRRELETLTEEESAIKEALHEADAAITNRADALARVERELSELREEAQLLISHQSVLEERRGVDAARRDSLLAELAFCESQEIPPTQDAPETQDADAEQELEQRSETLLAQRRELEGRAGALGERTAAARARQDHAENALAQAVEDEARRRAVRRRASSLYGLAQRIGTLSQRAADIGRRRALEAIAARDEIAQKIAAEGVALEADRQARRAVLHDLEAAGERLRRAELDAAEVGLRLESAENAQAELGGGQGAEDIEAQLPDGLAPEDIPMRIRHLRDDIARLGPINPLALAELEAVSQRYEFLTSQLEDVRASRRELEKVLTAINAKIIEIFESAIHDVSRHFSDIFARLFPGGSGALVLTDPTDVLESGVEVEARPAGKRLDKLSLLSGGEKALTALAFLFAVFRARPSPFYVLDEVEAALDDVNLHRFIELLEEFRGEAQLLVVTHQKRTMECADCLYGVTMREDGTTTVVSQRMADIDAWAMTSS